MLDSKLFLNAIEQISEEKKIGPKVMEEALREAFEKTYRREFDPEADLRVDIDMVEGEIKLYHLKNIVDVIEDELTEIHIDEARIINKNFKVGDKTETEVEFTTDFSILAALQVKQIIRQKIREKEKEMILNEYTERMGDMIYGNVDSVKENFYVVAFDNTFGFLNKNEVPKGRVLKVGEKVQAVIINVDATSKGVPIIISISSPELVKRIIEQEVPEVLSGDIVIENIARFAGFRTKILVKSLSEGLDPVGTIVGENGERIQNIIAKVGREFIDIIPVIEDKAEQIARALVPAKVTHVRLEDDKAIIVVDENNFSAAIGRGGSNAKVVSRLLDVEIEIKKVGEVSFDLPVSKPIYDKKPRRQVEINVEDYMADESMDEIEDVNFKKPRAKKVQEFDFQEFNESEENTEEDYSGFETREELEGFEDVQEEVKEDVDFDAFEEYYEE